MTQRRFDVRIDDVPWQQVADLAQAGPDDEVFVVDVESGTVAFGDGVHGRRPASGTSVSVVCQTGGDTAGSAQIVVTTTWPPRATKHLVVWSGERIRIAKCSDVAERFSGMTRLRFFSGQILTPDDLRDEQQYHLQGRWLHNRLLHGDGVVTGLAIAVDGPGTAAVVTVQPGIALDSRGREIVLAEPMTLSVAQCDPHIPHAVLLEYACRETDPVPDPCAGSGADAGATPTRIEDGAMARLAPELPPDAVAIGRIVHVGSGWMVDPDFAPRRPR